MFHLLMIVWNHLRKTPKTIPSALFGVKFLNSVSIIFLEFYCGIKNDVLGLDDSDRPIDILVFLNPEIASNLQLKHPVFNSVSKNVFLI